MVQHQPRILICTAFVTSWDARVEPDCRFWLRLLPHRIPVAGEQVLFGEVTCEVESVEFQFDLDGSGSVGYHLDVVIQSDQGLPRHAEVEWLIEKCAGLGEYLTRAQPRGHVVMDQWKVPSVEDFEPPPVALR